MIYSKENHTLQYCDGSDSWRTMGHISFIMDKPQGLYGWGRGDYGRIGAGTTNDHYLPAPVSGGNTDWTVLSAGTEHSCGIRNGGELYCWGRNNNGRTGFGTTSGNTLVPTQVGSFTDWFAVAAGKSSTCALRGTGLLYCWGSNDQGRTALGTTSGNTTAVTQVGSFTDWDIITTHDWDTFCARRSGGRAYCWGDNLNGEVGDGTSNNDKTAPTEVSGGHTDWTTISTGSDHSCGIRNGGRLYCWGWNDYGQLGDNTFTARTTPTEVNGSHTDWTEFYAGATHSCGIRNGGQLYCWGNGDNGEVGNGGTTDTETPTLVSGGYTDWDFLAPGWGYTCGIRNGGELWCWGYGDGGALGNGSGANQLVPVRIGAESSWKFLAACEYHTLGLLGMPP